MGWRRRVVVGRGLRREGVVGALLLFAGRISFYIQNQGEEATQTGVGKALQPSDHLFCQYRWAALPACEVACKMGSKQGPEPRAPVKRLFSSGNWGSCFNTAFLWTTLWASSSAL